MISRACGNPDKGLYLLVTSISFGLPLDSLELSPALSEVLFCCSSFLRSASLTFSGKSLTVRW